MRTPIISANWKMNKLIADAQAFVGAFQPQVDGVDGVEIVLFPTFTALPAVAEAVQDSRIMAGGQNCYTEESGAYTGELSPQMLLDAGAEWVIAGHSERRQYFGETDDFLNEKLRFALRSGLKVTFCIGETLEERDGGDMDAVLRRQVREGFREVSAADLANVVIAYEPVWAIGTGKTATPDQAQEAHGFVRALIREHYNETVAEQIRIQYGGSVKPGNAVEILAQQDVDGALVGGASLDPDSFAAIIKAGVAASAAR